MDSDFDPNMPDCTNGDFFCKLCLASMNSEPMWSSHIAGKRHIKNVIKYPRGLPKRLISDDEDSCDRLPKRQRYDQDWEDEYPPPNYEADYYHGDDYYSHRPPIINMNYKPLIKPDVVYDYGHTKKLEDKDPPAVPKEREVKPIEPKKKEVIPPGVNVDEIINTILKSDAKIHRLKTEKKDDFFEKINQREMAKDIAKELSKKGFYNGGSKAKVADTDCKSKNSGNVYEKYVKKKSSDIFDIIHKHNDQSLFKVDDDEDSKQSSSSKKSSRISGSNLDDVDPDKLSPDKLDELLSSYLKPKNVVALKPIVSLEKVVNVPSLDDPQILAEKLEALPTMTFLQLIHKIMKKLNLKDSAELKLLLRIIKDAQTVVCKKLPSNLQALVKANLCGVDTINGQVPVQNTATSLNNSVTSNSSPLQNTTVSQIPNVASIPSTGQSVVSHTVTSTSSLVPGTQSETSVSVPAQSSAVSLTQLVSQPPPPPAAVPPPPLPLTVPSPSPSVAVSQSQTYLSQIQNVVVSPSNSVFPPPIAVPPPQLPMVGPPTSRGGLLPHPMMNYTPMPVPVSGCVNPWQNYQNMYNYNNYNTMTYPMQQNNTLYDPNSFQSQLPLQQSSAPKKQSSAPNKQSIAPRNLSRKQRKLWYQLQKLEDPTSKPEPQTSKDTAEALETLKTLAEEYSKDPSSSKKEES